MNQKIKMTKDICQKEMNKKYKIIEILRLYRNMMEYKTKEVCYLILQTR